MNRATTFELECFVAVAEELNFSRAARRLHLSQPPLSRHIQALEGKLGARLFDRNTRGVALTPAGSLYLEDARQILLRLDSAGASVRRAASGETSRLRLAFIGALLDETFVQALQAFRRLHPQCQIHLTDLSPGEQLAALRAGQVDGGFIGAPPRRPGPRISTMIWKEESLLLVLPESHPFAAQKAISPGALDDHWVMVSRAAAPAFREQFDRLCASRSIRPRVVQESERAAAVLTMVAAGQGISLLPESMSRLIHPGVIFRALKGAHPVLQHAFAWRSGDAESPVTDFVMVLSKRG